MGPHCHELLLVRARLNQLFGERGFSLHNKTKWLPRSPDLTPCYFFIYLFIFFFFWGGGRGYLKDKVFRTPPESLNVLRRNIITECNLLRETYVPTLPF